MNKLLLVLVFGIAFFVGACAFNWGFVKGASDAIVAGTVKRTVIDNTQVLEPTGVSQSYGDATYYLQQAETPQGHYSWN
jgi:hypothetical protein